LEEHQHFAVLLLLFKNRTVISAVFFTSTNYHSTLWW